MPRQLKIKSVKEELLAGAAALAKHRCKEAVPAREAEELLAWATGVSREALYAHPDRLLTSQQRARFRDALKRRVKHEPIEYLTGRAAFMGRDFRVTSDTLIPRPATERLVEEAILAARGASDPAFMDVGTGSGGIAITLALTFPYATVLATDLSPDALEVARANARALLSDGSRSAGDRVHFVKADLLPGPVPSRDGATIIVANLPYIPMAAFKTLAPEVRRHEPRRALVGGKDGLAPSRRLVARIAESRIVGPVSAFFELLPAQCSRFETYAMRKLPGWRARRIMNAQGVAIGMALEHERGN